MWIRYLIAWEPARVLGIHPPQRLSSGDRLCRASGGPMTRLTLRLIGILVALLAVPSLLAAADGEQLRPAQSSGGRLAAKRLHDLLQPSAQSGGCVNEPDCDDEGVVIASSTSGLIYRPPAATVRTALTRRSGALALLKYPNAPAFMA